MEEHYEEQDAEAVMAIELFKTEELFRKRLKMTLLDLLSKDADIRYMLRAIAEERLISFKESMATNIRNSY